MIMDCEALVGLWSRSMGESIIHRTKFLEAEMKLVRSLKKHSGSVLFNDLISVSIENTSYEQ